MAAPPPPPPPGGPLMMLPWYDSLPLPNVEPVGPKVLGNTSLSRRLVQALDQDLFCDFRFEREQEELSKAHRVVLSRNPHFNLQALATPGVAVPPGISAEHLREVVRAHYVEVEQADPGGAVSLGTAAALASCKKLRSVCSAEEWAALEALFGPLDAEGLARWAPLWRAASSERFADCALRLPAGGLELPAHRCVVAGAEDGAYFVAALRYAGANGHTVNMPEGLSLGVLQMLLRMRCGHSELELEHVLEARHFADVLDWAAERQLCESRLEALLADSDSIDAESLLAVVTNAEESMNMPPRLKIAALAATIRQWSKVMDIAAAEEALPSGRRAELGVMSRIRRRDGHVCGSLEEYLHAAADDLTEWEHGMTARATPAARRQLEAGWAHFHQMLFEYGYIYGTANAEQWRLKLAARREALRAERSDKKTAEMRLPAGRVWFEATADWIEVPTNAICPAGLEYRFDMQTGRNYARLSS